METKTIRFEIKFTRTTLVLLLGLILLLAGLWVVGAVLAQGQEPPEGEVGEGEVTVGEPATPWPMPTSLSASGSTAARWPP